MHTCWDAFQHCGKSNLLSHNHISTMVNNYCFTILSFISRILFFISRFSRLWNLQKPIFGTPYNQVYGNVVSFEKKTLTTPATASKAKVVAIIFTCLLPFPTYKLGKILLTSWKYNVYLVISKKNMSMVFDDKDEMMYRELYNWYEVSGKLKIHFYLVLYC